MGNSLNECRNLPTPWAASRELSVGANACRLAIAGERLVARQVSSDVALAIHISTAGFAALLRFSKPVYGGKESNPWAGADTAIPLLLASVASLRLESCEISAYAVGGATTAEDKFGTENVFALRRILWREGIHLRGEDLGGSRTRSLWFDAGTGRAMVRTEMVRMEMVRTELVRMETVATNGERVLAQNASVSLESQPSRLLAC